MKKVFLSLAIVAAFTVVSCKQTEEQTEETTTIEETVIEEPVMEEVDTIAIDTVNAPIAE